ncbi:ATP-binding protein [Candidatus Shapirobacteria bacterium]|nr:ATP-binding protein [Candidatus Shapirobacteria bacterium]
MIKRTLGKKITNLAKKLPIIVVTGPRQSGKTTLLKHLFPSFTYVSLEDPDMRLFAKDDPRGFLDSYKPPVIFDEVQNAPDLFSYLQTISDKINKPGQFILSGSQNFLLLEKVSQSLAGRAGIVNLFPLSMSELKQSQLLSGNLEKTIFKGFYPRLWDKKIKPGDWYPSYIQTFLERDVRQIKQIVNLHLFQKFLKLCAGRTGQLLNLSSLAIDIGVKHNTIRSWLSVLEASFVIFLLQPYHGNLNKRLIKSPKLYFYDTGLVCSLLGITSKEQLTTHPLKGSLFETLIISEIQKHFYNQGVTPRHYFLQDKQAYEIDYLWQSGQKFRAVEIKSGQTVTKQYFANLAYWQKLGFITPQFSFVVYGGKALQKRRLATVLPWQKMVALFKS